MFVYLLAFCNSTQPVKIKEPAAKCQIIKVGPKQEEAGKKRSSNNFFLLLFDVCVSNLKLSSCRLSELFGIVKSFEML